MAASMDTQQYDDTVAGFYRAAQGLIPWSRALEPMRLLLGLRYTQLIGSDVRTGALRFSVDTGDIDPTAMREYLLTWHAKSPRRALVARLKEGEWMHCHEHFDAAFVASNEFYQQFLLPSGGRWCSCTVLVRDAHQVIGCALLRGIHQQPLNTAERADAARLARHLGDAVRLWRTELSRHDRYGVEPIVLNALRAPLVLIDPQRQVQMANAGARSLLDRNDGLRVVDGQLMASIDSDDRRLMHALHALRLGGGEQKPPVAEDRVFLRISRAVGRSPLALCLYALRPHGVLLEAAGANASPLALVLLHDPDTNAVPDPFFVAASFGFTPAEAKVTLALARGIKPKAIAHEHGVALSTVRSQLKSAMSKAGVRSQADLMSRLAALPMGSAQA